MIGLQKPRFSHWRSPGLAQPSFDWDTTRTQSHYFGWTCCETSSEVPCRPVESSHSHTLLTPVRSFPSFQLLNATRFSSTHPTTQCPPDQIAMADIKDIGKGDFMALLKAFKTDDVGTGLQIIQKHGLFPNTKVRLLPLVASNPMPVSISNCYLLLVSI